MRAREKNDGLTVRAVAGSYVTVLGLDCTKAAARGLLGFALERIDHTEDERYWMRGFKVFEETQGDLRPGQLASSREHPYQTFLWSDFTAKPDHRYTYRVVALYGKPKHLEARREVAVTVDSEPEDRGLHAIYFNRGVAASQAYARRFGNRPPRFQDRSDPAYDWLSRGLEEAMLAFIRQARGKKLSLRASVYEFNYRPALEAFKAAADSGVDVRIIYDRRRDNPGEATDAAVDEVGIRPLMIARKTNTSAISHNKFIVLMERGEPVQVWTGSTNYTWGGIYGQSNVGHIVRDPAVAQAYLDYWHRLEVDPQFKDIRNGNLAAHADLAGPPPEGTTPIFSPRPTDAMLRWYAERAEKAKSFFCLTAAFGVNPLLADAVGKEADHLRYLLLEKVGNNFEVYSRDTDTRVAVGSILSGDSLGRWVQENLTNLNRHVRFAHTKYMLIDPLSDDPLVVSGSANFSTASTTKNDENMLVVRGDTRVADIYLGEFLRLFNHHYFRFLAQQGDQEVFGSFLKTDDSWTRQYFEPGTVHFKQRKLFS